jgi:hypothetical protein
MKAFPYPLQLCLWLADESSYKHQLIGHVDFHRMRKHQISRHVPNATLLCSGQDLFHVEFLDMCRSNVQVDFGSKINIIACTHD